MDALTPAATPERAEADLLGVELRGLAAHAAESGLLAAIEAEFQRVTAKSPDATAADRATLARLRSRAIPARRNIEARRAKAEGNR